MNQIPPLIRVFGYLSLLTVGGGMAAFPETKILTVDVHKWLTFPQLIHLYSVGQMAPGPNMMMIVSIGQWAGGILGADRCPGRLFRADCCARVHRCQSVEKAREMAVENVDSAGTSAGIDRVTAGRLFQHGQRRHYRQPGNRGHCGCCTADPDAVQSKSGSAGAGQRGRRYSYVHAHASCVASARR